MRATVRLPNPLAALCLKLLSWDSRSAPKDAEDIWRMLAVCHAAGVSLKDWPSSATPRDALKVLKNFAAINSFGLRILSRDRTVHARVRALAKSVAAV